jgi:hypothetical protein
MGNSFWDKQFGNTPQQPSYQPAPYVPPTQGYPPVSQQFIPPAQAPSQARSAQQTSSCPECYSGNYMAVAGAAPRCYDCGYPISQSGSHLGTLTGARVEGDTKSAIGNNATNNWNPQGIIGRVD